MATREEVETKAREDKAREDAAKKQNASSKSTYDPETNPSGASEEQLRKGEMTGKVRGPDLDPSFHKYEFTDAYTGEPVETHQVIHDVPVGVNEDGSLITEKADKVFFQQGDEADQPTRRKVRTSPEDDKK
jgi:hypothetical protein